MGNNKIIIISGGAFVLFLVVIIFFNFLSKLKSTPSPENASLTPTVSVPFTGQRFIPPQNTVATGQEIPLFSKKDLITKLPLQTATYRVEYDKTLDQFNFYVSSSSTSEQALSDFNAYLEKNKLNTNVDNIHLNVVANKADTINNIAPTVISQLTTPQASGSAGESTVSVDSIMEIFNKQKQSVLHTPPTPTPRLIAQEPSPIKNTEPNSQSLIADFMSIFNTQKQQQSNQPTHSSDTQQGKGPVSQELLDKQKSFAEILGQVINQIKPVQPTTVPLSVVINPTPASDVQPINSQLFQDYGLPQPVSSGQYGYQNQLNRIRTNPTIRWNVESLLKGEKIATQKGINVRPYITTGWMWFEIGPAGYPDVYGVNCNDSSPLSDVSIKCTTLGSGDFQIAGYQAGDRAGDFIPVFNRLYASSQLVSIMNNVIVNSTHASKDKWRYIDNQKGLLNLLNNNTVPSSVSLSDIASNKSQLLDNRKQLFTLLLGKDPTMAIALNSFAVSDGDLIKCLKTQTVCYGYIDAQAKQRFSNIIAALILFDRGSLP